MLMPFDADAIIAITLCHLSMMMRAIFAMRLVSRDAMIRSATSDFADAY